MVSIPLKALKLEASGGIFGCYNIDPPLMTWNLDRYLITATTYETVTSSVSPGGRWGWGWVFGAKATYFVKGQIGIAAGANYYLGGGDLKLSGTFNGYDGANYDTDQGLPANLQTARLDYSGLEIILGVEIEL
jgi:hypothetical protein